MTEVNKITIHSNMEITDFTNGRNTMYSDVITFYIGKWIKVFTAHPEPICGTLYNYNQCILHVVDVGGVNHYISSTQVCAIAGDNK